MADTNKRHWLKIGVELEGGWSTSVTPLLEKVVGSKWNDDVSVRGINLPYHGELVTRPHSSMDKLFKDMLELWPELHNASCGMHIHTSFSAEDTGMLTEDTFWLYFQKRWLEWGEKVKAPKIFWDRFYGTIPDQSRRYKREWKPLVQLAVNDHNQRYTQLNFVSWHKFGTVECRLLPMFDSQEMAMSSVVELMDIYDTFLNTQAFQALKQTRKVEQVGDMVVEMNTKLLPEYGAWEEKVTGTCRPLLVDPDIEYEYDDVDGNEFVPTRGKPFKIESL
jgi:hypothetical protein